MECPRCGEHGVNPTLSISRWDNKTFICSNCGKAEAMLQHDRKGRPDELETCIHPTLGVIVWSAFLPYHRRTRRLGHRAGRAAR